MNSIEQEVKNQYAKVFVTKDWKTFKKVAEYYFKQSAQLKKSDIRGAGDYKLLIRNIQKRLFLGIGTELLVKAIYLKHGFGINKPLDGEKHKGTIHNLAQLEVSEFNSSNTFTLDPLINSLNSIIAFDDWGHIERGLKILKVFRNKEGHVAVSKHQFLKDNYKEIENTIISIYRVAFNEDIDFKISMTKNEKGKFQLA